MKTIPIEQTIEINDLHFEGNYQIDSTSLENKVVNFIRKHNDVTESYNYRYGKRETQKHNQIEIPKEWTITDKDFDSFEPSITLDGDYIGYDDIGYYRDQLDEGYPYPLDVEDHEGEIVEELIYGFLSHLGSSKDEKSQLLYKSFQNRFGDSK